MTELALKRTLKAWVPVVLWMGFIFVMSTDAGSSTHTTAIFEPVIKWVDPNITEERFEFVHFLIRKSAHLSEYAVLALLLMRALGLTVLSRFGRWSLRAAVVTLIASAAYASTDEFHQTFVAGRTPAVHDVVVDTTGALIAIVVAGFIMRDIKRPAKSAVAA